MTRIAISMLITVFVLAAMASAPTPGLALPAPGDPPDGSMIPSVPFGYAGWSTRHGAYASSATASGVTLSWDIGEATGWVRFAGAYTDSVPLTNGVELQIPWTPPGPIKVSATVTSATPTTYNIDYYYIDGSGDTHVHSGDLSGSRVFDFTFPYYEGIVQENLRLSFDEMQTPCDILIELEWGEPAVDSEAVSWGGVRGLYR
jgi:hypothetical protein